MRPPSDGGLKKARDSYKTLINAEHNEYSTHAILNQMVPLVSCIYLLGVFLGPLLTPIFFNIKRTIGICGKANAADAIICSKIQKSAPKSFLSK